MHTIVFQSNLAAVRRQLVEVGVSEFSGDQGANFLCDPGRPAVSIQSGQIGIDSLRHIMLDLGRYFISLPVKFFKRAFT